MNEGVIQMSNPYTNTGLEEGEMTVYQYQYECEYEWHIHAEKVDICPKGVGF